MPSLIPFRIGHGYDLHRVRQGGTLMMGGLPVSTEISPISHSDGDVVLHAIVDALCGALGIGDIGEHFPDNDPRWKGAASRIFVEEIFGRAKAAGYALGNVDVTIMAERPRLRAFKLPMKEKVAALLNATPDRVNIKAGTNEECDAVGRGEAVAAHAVVLLVPADSLHS